MKHNQISGYEKTINFLIFHIMFISLTLVVVLLKGNFLLYDLLVLLPSASFFLYLNKEARRKIIPEGFILGIFFIMVFELFALGSHSWYEPSMFNFRPFGVGIEIFIWSPLYVMLVDGYYEYFFDGHKSKKVPKMRKYWLVFIMISLITSTTIYSVNPNLFNVTYFYAIFISFFIVLEIIFYFKYKKFISKAILASFTLLPLGIIHEVASVALGHWTFEPGHDIGYLSILGSTIAIEEIIFIVVVPILIISIYEIMSDNQIV